MKVYPIGSISIFVNIDSALINILPDHELKKISDSIHYEFRRKLDHYEISNLIYSTSSYKRGCLITTIAVSIVIPLSTIAAAKGIYTFIKDYDKLKSNLKQIKEDFKNVFVRKKKKTLPTTTNDSGIAKSHTLDEGDYEIIKELPETLRKMYESGKDVYLEVNRTCYKICILRDDIKETISEKDIKKDTIEIIEGDI